MTREISTATEWPGFSETRLAQLGVRLKAFFRRHGSSVSDAEDLAQDVFLRLTKLEDVRSERTDAYVFTIARNLQRDRLRRTQVRRRNGYSVDPDVYPLIQAQSDALDAERVLIGKEEVQRLLEGLDEIPARTREILLLYRLEGNSQREIARQLGLSVSAVEKNVAKAMLYLTQKVNRKK